MSFYDEIKSPLEDEGVLNELVDMYVNNEDIYEGLTRRHPDVEKDDSYDEYKQKFDKYVGMPNMNRIFLNFKELIRKDGIERIDSDTRDMMIMNSGDPTVKDKRLYPISRFNDIFEKFDNYYEFCQQSKETDKEFMKLMHNEFYGGNGSMGFHVNPVNLEWAVNPRCQYEHELSDQMKFYLNAGADTYKVAQMFQEKCAEQGLDYYYKVVDPYENEESRTDKMCVFTSFVDSSKYLDIIKEIKKENPDIQFNHPPLLTGRIDDFIGVGMDHIGGEIGSYNNNMAKVCSEAMQKIFKGIPKEEIKDLVEKKPELLGKLKEEISFKCEEIGLSPDKICVREDIKEKLDGGSRDFDEGQISEDLEEEDIRYEWPKKGELRGENKALIKGSAVKKAIFSARVRLSEIKGKLKEFRQKIVSKIKDRKSRNFGDDAKRAMKFSNGNDDRAR